MYQTIEPSKIYSRKEVEETLGIAAPHLKRLTDSGEIVPKKLGRRFLFLGSELIKFLNNR